ncbi:MAG: methyltransferase domain-containing protein [Rubrivivax sp.]|jgi:SAM-dependent methyltransferase|nr:methyltransferase domain-containing protein [Rubrivivax sp.]
MDEAKLMDFMGKIVTDMGGAALMANVMLGDELGLYRAMADNQPVSAERLAEKTGCHKRLLREWLNAQAAAGYIELTEGGEFVLPPEQAMALAVEDSPVFIAGGTSVLAAMYLGKDKLVAAMRGNGGLPWSDQHPCLFRGTERFFRPGYRNHLVAEWLPALEGVVGKLEAGANVADVGCGHGASSVLLAETYPKSRFYGSDYHAASINTAKQRAAEAGVGDRLSFEHANAKSYAGRDFDLICFFDCLHDLGDPVGAAKHAHQALKNDGAVLLVEPYAKDTLRENFNPVGRLYYAASTCLCTPNSLSQEVGLALGAQAGEARLRRVFNDAGFKHFRRATETPFNLVFEARK